MKRISIALAALGISTSIFAALPAATDPTEISVPQLAGGFIVGATAYYLEPSNFHGDSDYALLSSGFSPTFFSEIRHVDPEYDWGWGVNVGYEFPGTGNDINASYLHFDNDESDTISAVVPNSVTSDLFPIFFVSAIPSGMDSDAILRGKVDYDFDRVDLTVGQYIDVGCRLKLHPNVGVQYADIDRKLTTTENGIVHSTGIGPIVPLIYQFPYLAEARDRSDFQGFGPQMGIDASYYVGAGFGVLAHFKGALLVGDVDDKLDSFLTSPGFPPPPVALPALGTLNFASKTDSTRRVVPNLDGSLAADYTYCLSNQCMDNQSNLTLEVGYRVIHYFNAIDNTRFGVTTISYPAPNTIIIVPGTVTLHRTSDFALNGPYVSLTYHS
jgi:hypothetical protein